MFIYDEKRVFRSQLQDCCISDASHQLAIDYDSAENKSMPMGKWFVMSENVIVLTIVLTINEYMS